MNQKNHQFLTYNEHATISEKEFLQYILSIIQNTNTEELYENRIEIIHAEISNRICKLGAMAFREKRRNEIQ